MKTCSLLDPHVICDPAKVREAIAAGADVAEIGDFLTQGTLSQSPQRYPMVTPLVALACCARKARTFEIVASELLDAGADINQRCLSDTTALHWVLHSGNEALAECFLRFPGIDLNARDVFGNSPLHVCNSARITQRLLELGADVNARDNLVGCTPREFHATDGVPEVVRVIDTYEQALSRRRAFEQVIDDMGAASGPSL